MFNTNEFYDPEQYNAQVHGRTYHGNADNDYYRPSIEGKTLTNSLPFWFTGKYRYFNTTYCFTVS